MRILLVDDDTSVIQALLAVLKTLPGHEVRAATSGEKALDHAVGMGGVDLLITDVSMDPMDGFTLCTKMMERYPATRTIFISGYDLSDYAESLQHYQVLQKPVTAEAFLAAVQRELAPRPAVATSARVSVPAAQPAGQPRAVAAAPRAVAAAPAAVATAVASQPRATAVATAASAMVEADPSFNDSESSAGLIGHVIGGYQIVTQLGEGRWGTVYAAVQTSINRPVGLKILDPVRARDDEQKQRFIADARAKAHVQHPSILAVYEAGTASGWIFYTHEYVDGHNLEELAQARRTFDEPTILKLLRVIADGFIYLTRNEVAHAPLEPGDIYLSVDGQPRLANLAASRVDYQPSVEQEIMSLGRAIDPLASANISLGLRALLNRMVQGGVNGITAWGALLQAVKALEPKIVPMEAAKISAQDRATSAAVEAARKQQKRSFYLNVGSMASLVLLTGLLVWWKFGTNERTLDEQVEIPAGQFLFGSGKATELEQFWIDKYEVTIGQYAKFVEFIEKHPEREKDYDHPEQPPKHLGHVPKNWLIYYGQAKAGGAARSIKMSLNSPMLEVTWWDAYAYAKWRGRELPTEQQWEKAARGARGFKYPWGDKAEEKRANTGEDYKFSNPAAKGEIDGFNYWADVDALKKDISEYGVVGMAGNVSEWTGDWKKKFPIIKGGNFTTPLQTLDSRIDNQDPNTAAEHIGFRTVSRKPPGSN
jgi:formylglycine-generating enzyme required for sulfatase activity/CheY-like chemotaxis protein